MSAIAPKLLPVFPDLGVRVRQIKSPRFRHDFFTTITDVAPDPDTVRGKDIGCGASFRSGQDWHVFSLPGHGDRLFLTLYKPSSERTRFGRRILSAI